ncbi:envelope glycoprotein H [Spheniscid alphaherpesvirus 1]|uniref:Envelope glycoprotein H n=1 Tax=Spheniscid alphaherpesvirus 1 TaxID=2560777 RepID=A0A1R3T897_9ALPH|nr:envelope glycoprotein H [Spheniscid alphaherpesvirus 1]
MLCNQLAFAAVIAAICLAYAAVGNGHLDNEHGGNYNDSLVNLNVTITNSFRVPGSVKISTSSLNWSIKGFAFVFFSWNEKNSINGQLLYLEDFIIDRLPIFNEKLTNLLMSKNMVNYSYVPFKRSQTFMPRSTTVPGQNDPAPKIPYDGRLEPTSGNAPRKFSDLTNSDLTNLKTTFVNTGQIATNKKTLFLDPFDSFWPVRITELGNFECWSNGGISSVVLGSGFMAATFSSKDHPPLELVVVPKNTGLAIIWPGSDISEHGLPGPSRGPRYKTYVLGHASQDVNTPLFKTMRTIAAYPEESSDYRYHLSQAHLIALTMLSTQNYNEFSHSDAEQFFYPRLGARIASALFSFIQTGHITGYVSLGEIIDVDINVKLLSRILMYGAAGGSHASFRLQSSLTPSNSIAPVLVERALNAIETSKLKHFNDYAQYRKTALSLAYAIHSYGSTEDTRIYVSAEELVYDLYYETLFHTVQWNSTSRHALFFACGILTDPARLLTTDAERKSAMASARRTIMATTSMCTATHGINAGLKLHEIEIGITDGKMSFSILDLFSPCMASTRYDFSEDDHLIDLLAAIPSNEKLTAYLNSSPKGRSDAELDLLKRTLSVITSWSAYDGSVVSLIAPELVACNADHMKKTIIAALPMPSGGSYIVTRIQPDSGNVYRIDGVSVTQPLFVTFLSGSCTKETNSVLDVNLPVPIRSTDCLYCGCIFMRYKSSGVVMDLLYIPDSNIQKELVAGENSSIPLFNPTAYDQHSSVLLLFPNGTVVRVLAFERRVSIAVPTTYIIVSLIGITVAGLLLYGIIRMVLNFINDRGYRRLQDLDP